MSKWIAEFDLEDGDTMPEHMDLNYMGSKIDFYCRPMWIPVSERLPERVEWYLTSIKWDDGTERVTISWFDGISFKAEVIAWMPLPESYRGESDE